MRKNKAGGRFLTELNTTTLSDDSAQLSDDLVYQSQVPGARTIVVPRGIVTDFASVPRVPLIFEVFGGTSQRAAVLHDYLYTMRKLPRKTCDAIFYEAMRVSGRGWLYSRCMWLAVRLFGASHYTPVVKQPIQRSLS